MRSRASRRANTCVRARGVAERACACVRVCAGCMRACAQACYQLCSGVLRSLALDGSLLVLLDPPLLGIVGVRRLGCRGPRVNLLYLECQRALHARLYRTVSRVLSPCHWHFPGGSMVCPPLEAAIRGEDNGQAHSVARQTGNPRFRSSGYVRAQAQGVAVDTYGKRVCTHGCP